MSDATASAAASICIGAATYTYAPAREPIVFAPRPFQPDWLALTQMCLRNSVISSGREIANDGRWVKREIADAANDFFLQTADLLPSEPIMYSTQQGDLVAEFRAAHGTMTGVISETFVLLFAVVDGSSFERRVTTGGDLRGEVQRLTELLTTGKHGSLASSK